MKKIVKLLLAFVLVFTVFGALFAFNAKVNAEPVLTDPNIVVRGASLRSDEKQGMRFVASVKDYEVPDGKTIVNYGFVIALGEAEASEDFVLGGTVNGKSVASVRLTELSDDVEKEFLCTIFNIPASSYGTDLSARAFVVLDDDTYVYGAESSVKSLAYVALQAIEAGDVPAEVATFAETIKGSLATGYKKYFVDAFGSFIVDNSVYETEPAKLFVAFANDWNAFAQSNAFSDDPADENPRPALIDATATGEAIVDEIKNALNGQTEFSEDRAIVKFFRDATYGVKWDFLLELFYNGGTIIPEDDISLKAQVEVIRDVIQVITKNDWYNAYNLITYIGDFFSQTSKTAFPTEAIPGIQWLENNSRLFFIRTTDVNTVSVLADGANVVSVGDKVTLPATAPKTGYVGYYQLYLNGATVSSGDYAVGDEYEVTDEKAIFLREYYLDTYNITYNLNGGTNAVANPATYQYTTPTFQFADATKNGYTFAGWYTDSEFTTPITQIEVGSTGDVTVYAKWTAIDYTITYNLNEGTNAEANPATYTIEDAVTFADATKDYYTFNGWYTENTFTNAITEITVGTTGNKELFAKFTPVDYTITYNLNGNANNPATNAVANPATYNVETPTITLADASRPGYTFAGWYSDEELTTAVTTIDLGSNGNKVLYAKWDLVDYTITYVLPDGATNNEGNPATINAEQTVTLLAPSKPLYTFIGWYKEAGFTNVVTTLPLGSTANVTLYAKFEETQYKKMWVDSMGNVYIDSQVFESDPAKLYVLFATDWNAFITENYPTETALLMNTAATNAEIGDEVAKLRASAIFSPTDKIVLFFADADVYTKWSWLFTMLTDAVNNPIVDTTATPIVDESLAKQIAAIEAIHGGAATYAISKNDWYNANNLITYLADFFTQTGYSAFPPVPGVELKEIAWWVDGTVDNRAFFANTLNYNNVVLCAEPNRVEIHNNITLPDYPCPTGKNPYYMLGGVRYEVGDTYQVTATSVQFLIEFEYTDYTITYNLDGGTNAVGNPATYTINDTPLVLAAATKTGYAFDGWYTDEGLTTPLANNTIALNANGNLTVYAKFTPADYTITYNLDGGTNAAANPAGFQITTPDITLADPTKTGYTFGGWFKENTFVNQVTTIATGTHENVELFAKWTAINYTITYELDGGTNAVANPATYTVADAVVLANASKTGYTFVKWTEAGEDTTGIAAGTTGNKTFTAVFALVDYTITYNLDGGTNAEANPAKFQITSADIALADPTKTGYTFGGWFKENTFVNQVTTIATGTHENVELFAKWTAINYTITYELDGGTNAVANPATYTVADAVVLAAPTKTGYVFVKWTEAGVETTGITAGTTGNKTFTAVFALGDYTITYNLDGGTNAEANPIAFQITTPDIVLADATKTGYTFAGWFKENTFVNQVTTIATGSHENVVLYAKWTAIQYTITYELDGGTNAVANPATYTIADAVVLADATKTGYTFVKWTEAGADTTGIAAGTTGNKTFTAVFALVDYTITYNLDGGTNAEANPAKFQITSADITLAAATKAGFDFAGWFKENTFVNQVTTIASGTHENVVLYAKYVNYTVTYNLNGGTNAATNPVSFTSQDAFTFADATKAGYEFGGWFLENTFVNEVEGVALGTTANVEVFAKFTAQPHQITFDFNDYTPVVNIWAEFIADVQEISDARAEYNAGFLTHSQTLDGDLKGSNEYYYDYLPLKAALLNNGVVSSTSEQFRAKYEWLFDAIASTHSLVSNKYTTAIQQLADDVYPDSDAVYVFCQELKALYYTSLNANYNAKGFTDIQLSYETTYDWANDPDNQYEALASFSETPSVAHNIPTDDALVTYVANPTRDGYVFAGWNTKEDGTGDTYTTAPASDITLYAMWN